MPKNVKGTLWEFLNVHSVAKYQKIDVGSFGAINKFRGKMRSLNSFTVPKKRKSLIVSKKALEWLFISLEALDALKMKHLVHMVKVYNAQNVDRSR